MSIPFWFHSLRLQLLSRLKFTNIIGKVCIPNLALQLHITTQLHIQKKHFQSHTLYKLSPLFSQKPKESWKEIVHVHRTCSARLSHSDLSDPFPLLWHYSDLPVWSSRTTCSPCPYSQFLTIWQLPKSAPIFSAWNSTSSPSFLAGTFSSRKDRSSFWFMFLYVTTGWLAVRVATIIDCFSLHPTKYPSLGIFWLFPLLVTFLPPPDPNSPALLFPPFFQHFVLLHIYKGKRQYLSIWLQASFNNITINLTMLPSDCFKHIKTGKIPAPKYLRLSTSFQEPKIPIFTWIFSEFTPNKFFNVTLGHTRHIILAHTDGFCRFEQSRHPSNSQNFRSSLWEDQTPNTLSPAQRAGSGGFLCPFCARTAAQRKVQRTCESRSVFFGEQLRRINPSLPRGGSCSIVSNAAVSLSCNIPMKYQLQDWAPATWHCTWGALE